MVRSGFLLLACVATGCSSLPSGTINDPPWCEQVPEDHNSRWQRRTDIRVVPVRPERMTEALQSLRRRDVVPLTDERLAPDTAGGA